MNLLRWLFACFLALGYPAQLLAEPVEEVTIPGDVDNAFVGDFLTIGAGVAYAPDYEGSNDLELRPVAGFRARLGDIRVFSRGIGLGADLIPDPSEAKIAFSLGPVIRYRADRAGKVKDRVVRLLPRLDETWEAGVAGGVTFEDLLNSKDALSLSGDVRWSFAGNKGGRIIATSVSYFTPLSHAAGAGFSFGADHVNRAYADHYYSIDAAGSAASGLPAYQGRGGWKSWSATFFGGYDLDGNIRNGGWAVGAVTRYERLRGSAAQTPITAIRGDRNQWLFAAGLGYTF